ncbi:MAG: hypothetical protein LBH00_12035, partial [Planctomycetaceae bacterium]|nr:hypothetical protein [Planctomycetaceae bacterium]
MIRTLLFCATVVVTICMSGSQAMEPAHNPDYYKNIYVGSASILERKNLNTLKQLYRIEEHKRIVPAGNLFDLPNGLKIISVKEGTYQKHTSRGIFFQGNVFTNSSNVSVPDSLCPVLFEVKFAVEQNNNSNLSLEVTYFEVLNECRDYALLKICNNSMTLEANVASMRLVKDDKIGDDLCFIRESALSVTEIIFMRQNTCFHFRNGAKMSREDILAVARYIDKRFVELNEELNKPKPPEKGKPPEQKTGNDEKNNGKT